MQNANTLNKITILADILKSDSPVDASTRRPPRLTRFDSAAVDVSLLRGGEPADVSGLAAIELQILDIGEPNSPEPRAVSAEIIKTATASEIDASLTAESLSEGGRHASFSLDEADSSLSCGWKWLRVVAVDSSAAKTTFAQGWMFVDESYSQNVSETREKPEIFLEKTDAEILFLKASENLADISDADAARANIGTYSKNEVDDKISTHTHPYLDETAADSLYTRLEYYQSLSSEVSSLETEEAAMSESLASARKSRLTAFPSLLFKTNSCALAKNRVTSFPFSIFATVRLNLSDIPLNGRHYIYSNMQTWSQGIGFYLVKSASSAVTLELEYYDNQHLLSFTRTSISGWSDADAHQICLCVGSDWKSSTTGKLDVSLYIDGLPRTMTQIDQNATSMSFTPATYAGTNLGIRSTQSITRSTVPVELSRLKIFNFRADAEGSLYTPSMYFDGFEERLPLLNGSRTEQALFSTGNTPNKTQWTDISAQKCDMTIFGESYSRGAPARYDIRGEAVWATASMSGIYLLKDEAIIPAGARFEIFAKSSAAASFNIGDDSSATALASGTAVGTAWTKIFEGFPSSAIRVRLTPTASFSGTVNFKISINEME